MSLPWRQRAAPGVKPSDLNEMAQADPYSSSDARRVARMVSELIRFKRIDDAISLARAGVAAAPELGVTWNVLSYAYSFADGLEAPQLAAALEAVRLSADDATAWHNLSIARMRNFDFERALEASQQALLLPSDLYVATQAAFLASLVGAPDRTLAYLDVARSRIAEDDSDSERLNAEIDLAAALAYASLPDWPEFLRLLETRHALAKQRPSFLYDMWKRERLWRQCPGTWIGCMSATDAYERSRISEALVYLEWGIGDQIQFARLIPSVLKTAFNFRRVTVACSPSLMKVIPLIEGVDEVIEHTHLRADRIPPDVAVIPVIDLMGELGRLGRFPLGAFSKPYIRPPSPQIAWEPAREPGKIAIAFSWQGDPKQTQDFARRIPFAEWGNFARLANERYTFHSMQTKFAGPIDPWQGWPEGVHVDDCSNLNRDMRDAAELIGKCDVFVGQCGALLHLAGALGKPAVAMLGYTHDFRWDYEPLYDCVLVKQTQPGNWPSAFAQLEGAIEQALTRRTAEFSQQES